jgi:hypothetical protein
VWDSTAMESIFSSRKPKRIARDVYHIPGQARIEVSNYIKRFYRRGTATGPSPTSARWSSNS